MAGKCILAVIALVTSIIRAVGTAAEDAPHNTLIALQGRWKVVSSPADEFERGRAFHKDDIVVVAFDRMKVPDAASGAVRQKVIALGLEGDPRQINLEQDEHAKGWSAIGIFRIRGDTLTLAITQHGNKRPTTFDSGDEAVDVIVLSRVPVKKNTGPTTTKAEKTDPKGDEYIIPE